MLFPEDIREQCKDVFEGVDGHDVPDDQLFNPDPKLIPRHLREGLNAGEKNND
jgi:hypothetical protein